MPPNSEKLTASHHPQEKVQYFTDTHLSSPADKRVLCIVNVEYSVSNQKSNLKLPQIRPNRQKCTSHYIKIALLNVQLFHYEVNVTFKIEQEK